MTIQRSKDLFSSFYLHSFFATPLLRLKLELRGKDADVGQLRGKVKRLVKSRDLLDEEPVRLEPKTSKSSSDEVPVVEELVLPTDAAPQEGSRC